MNRKIALLAAAILAIPFAPAALADAQTELRSIEETRRAAIKTADGKPANVSRFSHVFVRRKGSWVCIAGQSTPLPS